MVQEEKLSRQREEYISRINIVQDYIESHISEGFSLEELAGVAQFSPFHFHRIFSAMTGETLFQFIQRVRLEKSAFLLLTHKNREITPIALDCGFSNQASFAKAFKAYFGTTASQFRAKSKICEAYALKTESNLGKELYQGVCYNTPVRRRDYDFGQAVEIPYTVEVKDIPDRKVVYIRHSGPYKKNAALFERLNRRLYQWAEPRGLLNNPGIQWITLFHDQTGLTEEHKLRISFCLAVEGDVQGEGEIGNMTIPGGKYAIGHFELKEDQYQEAWRAMVVDWLPESGYQPDDRYCFECYPENSNQPCGIQKVDIYLPLTPLSYGSNS